MTNPYATEHNQLALAWKRRSWTLPDEARVRGVYETHQHVYPICLPIGYTSHNLLPKVRDGAIVLFTELDIPWHDSVGGPRAATCTTPRCSASACIPIASDPRRIKRCAPSDRARTDRAVRKRCRRQCLGMPPNAMTPPDVRRRWEARYEVPLNVRPAARSSA